MRSLLLALVLTACPAPDAAQPAAPPAAAPMPPAAPADGALSGVVTETMDAAGYTYLHLDTPSGTEWAAVDQTSVQVGDRVQITKFSWMQGFHSKTLDRTFDRIAFGRLGAAAPSPGPTGGVDPYADAMMGGRGAAKPAAAPAGPVAKAEGANARTISELYAGKAGLAGKPVTIRGRVVKFTGGVMNTNWMHLQDGSGSAGTGDNDITVTTDGDAAIGDVIVVTGTVATDKDLGAGYKYDVLVEDATIAR